MTSVVTRYNFSHVDGYLRWTGHLAAVWTLVFGVGAVRRRWCWLHVNRRRRVARLASSHSPLARSVLRRTKHRVKIYSQGQCAKTHIPKECSFETCPIRSLLGQRGPALEAGATLLHQLYCSFALTDSQENRFVTTKAPKSSFDASPGAGGKTTMDGP